MEGTCNRSRRDATTDTPSGHAQGRIRSPRKPLLVCSAAFVTLFSLSTLVSGQDVGATTQADDLPVEFQVLWAVDARGDRQWTLVCRNDRAVQQAELHADLNVVRAIWHLPISRNKNVFKFEFTRPIRTKSNVVHLYVQADRDRDTGRKHEGVHQGVDYMFTLIDGDANHANTRLDAYEADGKGYRGACAIVPRGATLYLAAEMTLGQQDGQSVFDYHVLSYVADGGPSVSLGYQRAASAAAPEKTDSRWLANPKMVVVNGSVPGWQLLGGSRPTAARLSADDMDKALVLENLYYPEGLSQTVSLAPGHYLLRALAKTNIFQVHLFAGTGQIPVRVSDEHQWAELPFHVPHVPGATSRAVQLGFRYQARPATGNASRLPARLSVQEVELRHLGDTALPDQWAETLPVDPLHGLRLLAQSPCWNQPGKVVFQDSFIGTEMWLMTQEGQVDHSYVGHPDFSHEGKYFHIGLRRSPRGVLRTDGSMRYLNDAWSGLVWLFPWEQKHLPPDVDPADWIVTSRDTAGIDLLNLVTRQSQRIALPARAGWRIVHFPGIASYGGRGPDMRRITHDTFVWFSDDNRSVARSNSRGESFTTYPLQSVSQRPELDTLHADMSSVGGKAGDNWRDAVDRKGTRYYLFELNRDHLPDHPTNPYQVWALPLAATDSRGLLRVVPHPQAVLTEYVSSQTGVTVQPSAKWWDFAAGFPWSGDNAILLLEDGTLVHMSSLGVHSGFGGGTISVHDSGPARYIGTYPKLDRITWPHEYRRDRDYAVVASHAEPATPLVMLDLEHTAMWTLALTNFHDYAMRYKTRWNPAAYHKPMFRPAPTFSPDFTKVIFFSAMLTGDHPDRKWGDVYVAVARYPEPPVHLQRNNDMLEWELPRHHAEIQGFRLYWSADSGRGYQRVDDALLTATQYRLPRGASGFYALTSVEYSGLESRAFSNEVCVGEHAVFRHFYRPATGQLKQPMVPVFDPAGAGDAYAVAITDRDLLYKEQLENGLQGSATIAIRLQKAGRVRIWARVRGLSALERSTCTTGWPLKGRASSGAFTLRVDGKTVGAIPVEGFSWHWIALDAGTVPLSAGEYPLEIATSDVGIAIDNLVVTNDPDFVPRGRGRVPEELNSTPMGLRVEPSHAPDGQVSGAIVRLTWRPITAPQGVSHYNVYRSDADEFEAEPETLLGSPSEPAFTDFHREAGRRVYYRVRAVDAWGNLSPASTTLAVTLQ